MYFHNRAEAGDKLADVLQKYRYKNTVVLALSPGGVVVGEQIARRLHCNLTLLLTARITAPGDESLVIGTLDQGGGFVYNSMIPAGEMEGYLQDLRAYVEEQKIQRMYQMATLVGENGMGDESQIEGRNVIIATDGVKNGLSFDAAVHYLRRVHIERTIAAVPVGPAETMERLRGIVDELHYLYIPESFFSVAHYYINEPKIDSSTVMDRINNVAGRWI